ncbi:MAG: MFS transporter [Methanobacteriota archaeon]|nr:MAG: MFS transporter [Euryarchaeota archaeon]
MVRPPFHNWYLPLFGFFYFGQGYSLGSLALMFPIYIRDVLGVASEAKTIFISSMLLFPWYLKFVYGFVSDNFPIGKFGRRKPYLVIAAVLSFYGWITLLLHESVNMGFILSSLSLAFGSAISDTVIDGLGVEITPRSYVSRLQGTAWGGRGLGIGMAGIASSLLVKLYGWAAMMEVSAFFGISMVLVVLILPEGKMLVNPLPSQSLNHIRQMLLHQEASAKIFYLLFSGASLAIIPLFSFLLNNDFDYDVVDFSIPSFFFAFGAFLGSFLMAIIFIKKETKLQVVIVHVIYSATLFIGIFHLKFRSFLPIEAYFVALGIGAGLVESFQLKVIQEISPQRIEGTAFAIWTGISNIGQFILGGILLSQLADFFRLSFLEILQFSHFFLILAVIALFKINRH